MMLRQRQALFSGIYFAAIMFIADIIWLEKHEFIFSLVKDAALGIGFGFFNYKTWNRNDEYAKRISQPPLEADERIICESPASHYTWSNGFRGKLFLTDRRLVFIPNEIFRPKEELTMARVDIARLNRRSILDPFNIKIIVFTASGTKEKFSVLGRKKWVRVLKMRNIEHKNT